MSCRLITMHHYIVFGPKCNISEFIQRNKPVAPSNEALIKSGISQVCGPTSYHNPPVWDFFSDEKQFISYS